MKLLGVDLGTRKLAVSLWEDGELLAVDIYVAGEHLSRAEQLNQLGVYIANYTHDNDADWIWFETIIVGNNRKYSLKLAEVYGACLASLGYSSGVSIGGVDNKQWKKEMLGNGNSNKDMIKKWVQDKHPQYAELCLGDQDRYDAVCVGLYGLTITGRADGLKLAGH